MESEAFLDEDQNLFNRFQSVETIHGLQMAYKCIENLS